MQGRTVDQSLLGKAVRRMVDVAYPMGGMGPDSDVDLLMDTPGCPRRDETEGNHHRPSDEAMMPTMRIYCCKGARRS